MNAARSVARSAMGSAHAARLVRGGDHGHGAAAGGSFFERMPKEYLVLTVIGGWAAVIFGAKAMFGGGSKDDAKAAPKKH